MKFLSFPIQLLNDFIKSVSNSQTRRSALILVGSIIGSSCLICFGIFAVAGNPESKITPTPELSQEEIINNALQGISDSFTQTALAIPTLTLTPSEIPTLFSTATTASTNTAQPTQTETLLPTATIIVLPPTQPPAQNVCPCSGDTLNCSDFSSHSSAQACFNYCNQQGAGDIHRLDGDGNGLACESL